MKQFLNQLVSNSLVMSIICLLFIGIKSILGERYAPRFRYYSWIILLVGFLIPFRPVWSEPMINQAAAVSEFAGTQVKQYTGAVLIVYIAGCVCLFLWKVIKHYCFLKSVRRLQIIKDSGEMRDCLTKVCHQMAIGRDMTLMVVPGLCSPMLVGLWTPCLLMPDMSFSREELTLVFRHELIHCRRRDLWYKLFSEAAHVLHWFNPLYILIKREIERDLEASCDEQVIYQSTEQEQLLYCQTILQVVRRQKGLNTAFSTSFGNSSKVIKKRLKEILSSRKKRAFIGIIFIVLGLTLLSGQLFGFSEAEAVDNDFIAVETTASEIGIIEDVTYAYATTVFSVETEYQLETQISIPDIEAVSQEGYMP